MFDVGCWMLSRTRVRIQPLPTILRLSLKRGERELALPIPSARRRHTDVVRERPVTRAFRAGCGLFGLLVAFMLTVAGAEPDYTRFVDCFIGTGGHGHTYPGASMPFGMVQLRGLSPVRHFHTRLQPHALVGAGGARLWGYTAAADYRRGQAHAGRPQSAPHRLSLRLQAWNRARRAWLLHGVFGRLPGEGRTHCDR